MSGKTKRNFTLYLDLTLQDIKTIFGFLMEFPMFVSRFLVTILLVRLMKLYILSDKVVFAVLGLSFVRWFCPYL